MKMANIDHCYDSMFTNPKDPQGVSERNSRHVLEYASVRGAASAVRRCKVIQICFVL